MENKSSKIEQFIASLDRAALNDEQQAMLLVGGKGNDNDQDNSELVNNCDCKKNNDFTCGMVTNNCSCIH